MQQEKGERQLRENEIAMDMLFTDYQEYLQTQHLYSAALKGLHSRLDILNDEFKVLYSRNPIHHIESRLKSPASIVAKLQRKGADINLENAKKYVNDIAGIRVVCCYIDDVYQVEKMILRQTGMRLIKRQDYIAEPNYNGYRSLHLDLELPVFLSDHTERVGVEVQIRTVAMDFWASLEHDLRYKKDTTLLPEGFNDEMLACADRIAEIDAKMQEMHRHLEGSAQ